MLKEEQKKLVNRQNEIINKINNKWLELQKDFYVCYSVKELAYKIAYEILEELKINNYSIEIYYRLWNVKHKIMFEIENDVWFMFDIYWVTGMYGDSGLSIGNGKLTNKLNTNYEDIENILEDEE